MNMNDALGIGIVLITVMAVVVLDYSKNKDIKKLLQWIPAILFAYIIPALFTLGFDLNLSNVGMHGFSKYFLIPLAIVLVMSALSVKQLRIVGWKPIFVFAMGSSAIALLPIILLLGANTFTDVFRIEILNNTYWKGLVTIVGSWIGGSTSQLVLKEVVGCSEPIFLLMLVLDNVLVNIWTILMFQFIKRSPSLNRFFRIKEYPIKGISGTRLPELITRKTIVKIMSICVFAVLSTLFINSFIVKIIILSVLGFILGNYVSFWNHKFVIQAGGYLIITIMAILGLKLDFTGFTVSKYLVLFAIVWLILHYIVMIVAAYFLKLNMAWVPICSMANVGGISTAPAVTKAYNESWMPHAILLAVLSMITGTYWGLLTFYLFQNIF